ncbi:tail assembly protein [Bordetella bronchiseptica]|uniref:tail assembly protein n=1 Tax=Bordetella bronchiseptica TaxID=518 RepID=UPI000F6EE727|nr:tail assembly protein [Bordetella bronchiseptica]VEI25181.1 Phage-related protein, tail component [Bordetella bronchiseptica]
MSDQMRTVRLYGRLGARFGRVHRLAVLSPGEAVQALCATLPGFEQELLDSEGGGVRFAVFVGKRNIGADDLGQAVVDEDIRIAPVIAGSKRGGLFQTILGAALVVGAGFASGGGAFAALGAGGFAGGVAGVGAAMFFGGIAQMLTPQAKGLGTRDNVENGVSYNFNGPIQTTAQGNCVPVLYGELLIGSAVVSAGIYAEDQA